MTTKTADFLNRKTRIHSGAGLRPASFSAHYKNQSVPPRVEHDRWNLTAELNASHSALRTYLWGLDLSGSMQGLPRESNDEPTVKAVITKTGNDSHTPALRKNCLSRGEGGLLMVMAPAATAAAIAARPPTWQE